jgi:hypothetical protein
VDRTQRCIAKTPVTRCGGSAARQARAASAMNAAAVVEVPSVGALQGLFDESAGG